MLGKLKEPFDTPQSGKNETEPSTATGTDLGSETYSANLRRLPVLTIPVLIVHRADNYVDRLDSRLK